MTDEFTPIRRANVPNVDAGSNGDIQVNVQLTARPPDAGWTRAFEQANKSFQGIRRAHGVRLVVPDRPRHPAENGEPTVWFGVVSDDDFEAAVAEVDNIIKQANALYTTVMLPKIKEREAEDERKERETQERQASLTERAKRLAPPS